MLGGGTMNSLFTALSRAFFCAFFCHFVYGSWEPFEGKLRYDEVCHFTSHNSYAALEHGYLYAQQSLSIEKQLAYGVRGLMLDIGESKNDVVLIHKTSFLTRLICRGKEPMPFLRALEMIRQFLEDNPLEVLTIFLENYVKDSSLLDSCFLKAGLDTYILRTNPATPNWPTFEWMRTTNKRLIIFNATGETKYCFDQWRHVVENQWGALHPARACRERPESKAHKKERRSLYLLNYFPFFDLNTNNAYERINTESLDAFLKRALSRGLDTQSQPSHLPTFLCLDYVEVGNGMKHVQHINTQKRKDRTTLL